MNTELILLKAQLEAQRTYFLSLLSTIFANDEHPKNKVWVAKYAMWGLERGNLYPSSYKTRLSSPETEPIDRRRFQLQVLMDVAYIQGRLEEYGVSRNISPDAYALAEKVYKDSDGSEETMLPLIDKYE